MNPTEAFEKALSEIYESLPQFFSESFCKEKKIEFPDLLPPNEEQITAEMKENILLFQKRCRTGFDLILAELKEENSSSVDVSSLEKGLAKAFQSLLSPKSFTRAILKVVSGTSWREALSLPQEDLSILYHAARNLFDRGSFAEAADAFTFLSWFDAGQIDFWMALGHSCFHVGSYKRAIAAYGVAAHSIPQDPWPHIHSAVCYEAIGDTDLAKDSLREGLVREESKEQPNKKLIESLETKILDLEQERPAPIA